MQKVGIPLPRGPNSDPQPSPGPTLNRSCFWLQQREWERQRVREGRLGISSFRWKAPTPLPWRDAWRRCGCSGTKGLELFPHATCKSQAHGFTSFNVAAGQALPRAFDEDAVPKVFRSAVSKLDIFDAHIVDAACEQWTRMDSRMPRRRSERRNHQVESTGRKRLGRRVNELRPVPLISLPTERHFEWIIKSCKCMWAPWRARGREISSTREGID